LEFFGCKNVRDQDFIQVSISYLEEDIVSLDIAMEKLVDEFLLITKTRKGWPKGVKFKILVRLEI